MFRLGERGIVDPRPVYSVGSFRWPVGGAVEVGARSARRCPADLIPFDGGALRCSAVEIPPFRSSRVFGSDEFLKPSPASAWRRRRDLFNKEEAEVWRSAMETQGGGVGSQELATGDFPTVEGLYLIQAIKRYGGGGAPPAASSSSSTSGSGGPCCNFSFVLDLSVRTGL